MMMDVSTIYHLELIQNLHDAKSKNCLFGLLNETQTPMGARLLRSSILQPLTSHSALEYRYDALEELTSKEEIFFSVRQALQHFTDVDKLLTSVCKVSPSVTTVADTGLQLVIDSQHGTLPAAELAINNIIMLKDFISLISSIHYALNDCCSPLLADIREARQLNRVLDFTNDFLYSCVPPRE